MIPVVSQKNLDEVDIDKRWFTFVLYKKSTSEKSETKSRASRDEKAQAVWPETVLRIHFFISILLHA